MSVAAGVETRSTPRRDLPPSMVERMTLILDAFDGASARLTLEDVSRRTHLPRSTAHRILEQLVRLEWLDHTSHGYVLGRRALGLASAGNDHTEVRAAAAPYLHELLLRTGAVVHLGVLEGDEVAYLDKVGGRFAVKVPSRVGGRMPAHCTALGKAMLAWLEPEHVDELVGHSLAPRTGSTIADLEGLHGELNRIRARGGLAFERGECYADIACVAAAIRGPEGPVAALSAVGGADMPLERVAPLVVNAARAIAAELHPDLPPRRGMRPLASV